MAYTTPKNRGKSLLKFAQISSYTWLDLEKKSHPVWDFGSVEDRNICINRSGRLSTVTMMHTYAAIYRVVFEIDEIVNKNKNNEHNTTQERIVVRSYNFLAGI